MLAKTSAKVNEVLYWSRPANWKNQTLTPNPDSIYFMTFWNVKGGPEVIDIPPAVGGSLAANIVNAWQMPLRILTQLTACTTAWQIDFVA